MFRKKRRTALNSEAPLTSENQYKETRKKINARNKQRATSMETRVARFLRGRRTPSSGAMAKYKGDVEIQLINNPGTYLIECKMSAMQVGQTIGIRLQFKWLPKIHDEAHAMNAKFGVLIVHFLSFKDDYVFISADVLARLMLYQETKFKDELAGIFALEPIDLRTSKAGKEMRSAMLTRDFFESSMVNVSGIKGAKFIFPDRDYIMLHLTDFRAIIEDV
jgi:hypothetical protein